MSSFRLRFAVFLAVAVVVSGPKRNARAVEPTPDLFRSDNLVAWCIVPFDAKKRGPEERAEMLARLGFKHFAYDYRAEHVPTFDAEIVALKKHGVSLDAWWFPRTMNDEARGILEVCKRHDVHPQLWVTGSGEPTKSPEEQRQRIEQEVARIRPIAEAAAAQGMKVALYNHGGWFGEPENQIAIIESLKMPNVGMVYNLHHGHDHLPRFAELLKKMLPHLLALNLNGMVPEGDKRGQKILQLGQGTLDLELLKTIRASGYRGPIGILGHTQDDAEARLQDNLDGLHWLLPQLDGAPAGPKPPMRTPVPGSKPAGSPSAAAPRNVGGWLIAGRDDYRRAPLSVEVKAKLTGAGGYNILVACDTKQSGAHWELFTMPQSGFLTAYLPGYTPDHVRSQINVADGKPHVIVMTLALDQVHLLVDDKAAAAAVITKKSKPTIPGDLAVGRLVEGTIGLTGDVTELKITHDTVHGISVDGHWLFSDDKATEVADASKLKNPAKRKAAAPEGPKNRAQDPPPGNHLQPVDPKLKATLIDRSPSDVYLGVKVDEAGTVFVGGREAVFVFEKQVDGKFAKRRELLRFPPDSIIMGLEFRNDDLYVLTDNALYLVPQGRVARTGLKPQRILWGLPLDLHVSFHCLAWGPDGLLYLTHGDPLLQYGDWNRPDHWGHWTLYCGVDDKPLPYTGQGAVLRMKPDGTDVHVMARGLRGPVGLAFDNAGNLFTNDNDHESRADQYAPSRLLHVVDGIDFGWPRGWMASKSPDRYDLIEPVCDLGRGAPCDLTYYDRPLLGDVVGDRLLMCRWDSYRVTAYRPEPRGMTFTAAEETIAVGDENCRPVGIAADREGRLYVTALYMTGNQAAPDCVSDLIVIERNDDIVPAPRPPRSLPVATDATVFNPWAADPFARQRGVLEYAESSSVRTLLGFSKSDRERFRLGMVLAIGRKLTVPDPEFVPPVDLELFYPKESSFFHRMQRFYGDEKEIDLADLGRVGSFTIAQLWALGKHTDDQKAMFAALVERLDDPSDRVRLQAAYFLSLLKDDRSEPLVESTRRGVQMNRLSTAPRYLVEKVWAVGPFDDGGDKAKEHGPERGQVDLAATYDGRAWQEYRLTRNPGEARGTWYSYFRVVSGVRQSALATVVTSDGEGQLRQNEAPVDGFVTAINGHRTWTVDLQPGSNDFLVRSSSGPVMEISLAAVTKLEVNLPEKLDSSLLAERLRSASVGGVGQPVPAEFAAVDWSKSARDGDAAEGRRLFGTLGCAKCHAVVPDQKSAGAPSLVEAKKRFTVPNLVESVLLPSRQVAEPFRAQTFVTADGRTLTGLVTGETEQAVELLLPDAKRSTLYKMQIEERAVTQLSPMPQGLVKTPDELRHLLSYLLSDRPLPP